MYNNPSNLKIYTWVTPTIGVRAGKFLGVRRVFSRIPQTCPKRFCATIFFHKGHGDLFGMTSEKGLLHVSLCFSANVGRIFQNETTLGAIFVWIFRVFAQIFQDFVEIIGILPGFLTNQ